MLLWLSLWQNWLFLVILLVGLGLALLTSLGIAKDLDTEGAFEVGKPDFHGNWFLAFMGTGRAPLSILLEVSLISFGSAGLLVNAIATDLIGRLGGLVFPVTVIIATVTSFLSTHFIGVLISKFAPVDAVTKNTAGKFVGSVGVAASSITHTIGQITIDDLSDIHVAPILLTVKLDPRCTAPIPSGQEVYVCGYDTTDHIYYVSNNNIGLT